MFTIVKQIIDKDAYINCYAGEIRQTDFKKNEEQTINV